MMSNMTLAEPPANYTGYIEEDHHHDLEGDTVFGFWVYILSDCILFATLFAVFAVLRGNFAGATEAVELFDLNYVLGETILLLLSSFTFGMAMLEWNKRAMKGMLTWLGITWLLGLGFLIMEINEFVHFTHEGAGAWDSGAWSAFYGLIGTHGLHVFAGMIWMIVLVALFLRDGFSVANGTRLACLSLFWHFLDIIWICVFSVVFLMGVV